MISSSRPGTIPPRSFQSSAQFLVTLPPLPGRQSRPLTPPGHAASMPTVSFGTGPGADSDRYSGRSRPPLASDEPRKASTMISGDRSLNSAVKIDEMGSEIGTPILESKGLPGCNLHQFGGRSNRPCKHWKIGGSGQKSGPLVSRLRSGILSFLRASRVAGGNGAYVQRRGTAG